MAVAVVIFGVFLGILVLYSVCNVVWHLPEILGFGQKKD
jgi:hypothetical protein